MTSLDPKRSNLCTNTYFCRTSPGWPTRRWVLKVDCLSHWSMQSSHRFRSKSGFICHGQLSTCLQPFVCFEDCWTGCHYSLVSCTSRLYGGKQPSSMLPVTVSVSEKSFDRNSDTACVSGPTYTGVCRCLPVSPKPDSPKLRLGVGVFQICRNPIRRNPFRRN